MERAVEAWGGHSSLSRHSRGAAFRAKWDRDLAMQLRPAPLGWSARLYGGRNQIRQTCSLAGERRLSPGRSHSLPPTANRAPRGTAAPVSVKQKRSFVVSQSSICQHPRSQDEIRELPQSKPSLQFLLSYRGEKQTEEKQKALWLRCLTSGFSSKKCTSTPSPNC